MSEPTHCRWTGKKLHRPEGYTVVDDVVRKETLGIVACICGILVLGLIIGARKSPVKEPSTTCLDGVAYWSYSDNMFVRIDPVTLQPKRCIKEL